MGFKLPRALLFALLAGVLCSSLSCEQGAAADGGADGLVDAALDGEAGVSESGLPPRPCSPAGWTLLESGVIADLYGVWGASSEQVVAVGADGVVLSFDGTRWRPAAGLSAALQRATWRAVWGSGAQEIYAVGDHGALMRFNGVAWQPESLPAAAEEQDLLAVGGLEPEGEVFAAGSDSTLLRRERNGWVTKPAPAAGLLLAGLAPVGQQLLAVGGGLSPASVVGLRYLSGRWLPLSGFPQTSGQLRGLFGDPQGRAIAVGRGSANSPPPLLRLEDGLWRSERPGGLAAGDELTAVWGDRWEALLVLGGGGGSANTGGLVLRFDGQRWERLELPQAVPRLNALWGWPSGEVIMVGDRGTALRYCEPPEAQPARDLGSPDRPDLGRPDLGQPDQAR